MTGIGAGCGLPYEHEQHDGCDGDARRVPTAPPESPVASPLLKAVQSAINAWRYPSMDGLRLSKAMDALEDAYKVAATEHRLALLAARQPSPPARGSAADHSHALAAATNDPTRRWRGSDFTISVSTRMAGADWAGVLRPQTVEASDLHDALRKALEIPFADWFVDDSGEVALEFIVDEPLQALRLVDPPES